MREADRGAAVGFPLKGGAFPWPRHPTGRPGFPVCTGVRKTCRQAEIEAESPSKHLSQSRQQQAAAFPSSTRTEKERLIPVEAHGGTQPHTDRHRNHCHPQDGALNLLTNFVHLDLPQVQRAFLDLLLPLTIRCINVLRACPRRNILQGD